MTDVVDSATRSRMMSGIRAKNTKPELALRRALSLLGARYRIHPSAVPGRPDVAFIGLRVAVFVHGCFWHGCPKHYNAPATRSDFWATKLQDNRRRDRRNRNSLVEAGWVVIEFWEHQVEQDLAGCIEAVTLALASRRKERAKPRGQSPRRASAEPRSQSA